MELNQYLDKKIQIILINGFCYVGRVIDCDSDSITIIDKSNSKVCLKNNSINLIKELER